MKRGLPLGLVAGLVILSLLSGASAFAHSVSVYYPQKWQSSLAVHWKFEASVPSTNFRDRIKDGAQDWTNLSPIMNFVKDAGDWTNYPYSDCPSTYQKNGVHWENIDGAGGTYGSVRRCIVGTEIWTFQMRFDSSETWYVGTSTSVPSNERDSWSAGTHEFGHATGFSGHFDDTSSICTTNPKHTMCPIFPTGESYNRSLEEHDVHTFTNSYP